MTRRWTAVTVAGTPAGHEELSRLVESWDGSVVGVAHGAAEALALARRTRPDLAVVAAALPDGEGLAVAQAVIADGLCPVLLVGAMPAATGERGEGPVAATRAALIRPLREDELALAPAVALASVGDLAGLLAENASLRRQLEGRKVIERAKGLLMQRLGLTEAAAFRRIQKTAMDSRQPMVDVARALLLGQGVLDRSASTDSVLRNP